MRNICRKLLFLLVEQFLFFALFLNRFNKRLKFLICFDIFNIVKIFAEFGNRIDNAFCNCITECKRNYQNNKHNGGNYNKRIIKNNINALASNGYTQNIAVI